MNVFLNENDVPGAALKFSRLEDHTVSDLKRWLACRNLPVGGLKKFLIKRVQDCITSGQDQHIFVGIDGGIWYKQKVCASTSAAANNLHDTPNVANCIWKKFPSIAIPRSFSLPLIHEWMVNQHSDTSVRHGQDSSDSDNVDTYIHTGSNSKALRRGRLSFRSGHVTEIKDGADDTFYYLKANVVASYRKVIYKTFVILHKADSKIVDAGCECKAGTGKTCSHVAGLLFSLEDYTLINKFDPPSSTSLVKQWNMGRKIGNNPQSVLEAQYSTPHNVVNDNRRRFSTFDPRKLVTSEDVNVKLLELINKYKINSAYEHLITIKYDDYELDTFVMNNLLLRISFVIQNLYDSHGLTQKCDAQNTDKWFLHRRMFITASEIRRFFTSKLLKNVIYNKLWKTKENIDNLPAIKWGKSHEADAFQQYKEMCNGNLEKCGFIVDKKFCGIGCSPDGLVFKDDMLVGTIEIKCPFILRESLPTEINGKNVCYVVAQDGSMQLKENHPYYLQVQTSMAILEIDWCDFIVWTPKGMLIQRIPFNKNIIGDVLTKITSIHSGVLIPEFLEMRLVRDLPLIILE